MNTIMNPKVSIVEETVYTVPIDELAKMLLDEDDYLKFKNNKTSGDEELQEYIKKTLTYNLDKLYVKVHINNAHTEISNALQRASTTEQLSYGLNVEYEDIISDDENMNKMELLKNIHLLPLRNGLTEVDCNTVELSINIKNDTQNVLAVLARDMHPRASKINEPLFYNNTALIYLDIGKRLSVHNIRITKGDTKDDTRYLTATNGSTFPPEREMGSKTPNSVEMLHEITFNVNAVSRMERPRTITTRIFIGGCDNLIERLRTILQVVEDDNIRYIERYNEEYILKIEETNSIAKGLERIYVTLNPEVQYIATDVSYHTKLMTLHIKGNNTKTYLIRTINTIITIYENIRKQFIAFQ